MAYIFSQIVGIYLSQQLYMFNNLLILPLWAPIWLFVLSSACGKRLYLSNSMAINSHANNLYQS